MRPTQALAAAQAKDREQERREEDLDTDDQERGGDHGEVFVGERAETVGDPRREDHRAHRDADEHERAAEQQAVLESEARSRMRSNQGSRSPMK